MIPKFRIFIKKEKRLIPSEDIYQLLFDFNGNNICVTFEDGTDEWYEANEIVLMQSTGLYIMYPFAEPCYERKEIFEGDILKWYYSEGIELQQQGIFVVVFENGTFRPDKDSDITLHEMLEDCDHIEVIGNICETPELAKEMQE